MARTTAVVLASLAGLLVAEVATSRSLEAYGVALVSALAVASATTAWRAWSSSSFEVRVAAAAVGSVGVVGQALASTFGGPGSPGPHWTALAVGVVANGALVVLAAASAPPRAPRARTSPHPYAL